MAEVSMKGDTLYVKVISEEGKGASATAGKPKTDTSDSQMSESADAKAVMGVGKQALGYIPGASEAIGAVDSTVGAGKTVLNAVTKGGIAGWAGVIALVLKLLHSVHELVSSYVKDKRQSDETLRRSGNKREQ